MTQKFGVVQHGSSSFLNNVVFLAARSVANNKPLLVPVICYSLILVCLLKIFRSAHMKVVNKLIIMSIFVRSKPKKNIQQSKIITI